MSEVENDANRNPQGSAASRPLEVRRAAVLGSGAMGLRIAAHLANAGVPVLLLDLPAEGNTPAAAQLPAAMALASLAKMKPAALLAPGLARLIEPGSFASDLARIAACDWVAEAVAEKIEIKTALLKRAVEHLKPTAILTTNTSGLPVGRIAAGVGQGPWRARFFGTHFFNPPRYMRLVELIATPETDPLLVDAFAAFADLRLGKQIVRSADAPNFVANRIGAAALLRAAQLLREQNLTIEEVDALTGPVIGWPRTGSFRLADMVGLDVLAAVVANAPESAAAPELGAMLSQMLSRGWLGDKSGQGFYKKQRTAEGQSTAGNNERLALALPSFEYRPVRKPVIGSLDLARNAPTVAERLQAVLNADPRRDRAAAFLWPFLAGLWNHAAELAGQAAEDIPAIDRAMRAGFNWELGPFELWDAAGVARSVEQLRAMNLPVSPRAQALLAAGHSSWYRGAACFNPRTHQFTALVEPPGHACVASYKRSHGTLRSNAGASLVDVGQGIAAIELHSMKNAIGADVLGMVTSTLAPDSSAVRDFAGFVISGDRDNFSVGANLLQLLLLAQEGEWEELRVVIAGFQRMTAAIKFCPRPVVVAPFGLTLGGGAEITLHAARRQAHVETYMGLVEAGVGLIPAGGGTKEMLLRAVDRAAAIAESARDISELASRESAALFARSSELQAALRRAFEAIALAKVSTSAVEARTLWFLDQGDAITMNRERLLEDAKRAALLLAESGYVPPQPRTISAPGTSALAALEMGVGLMREAGYASQHDQKVACQAAQVLCGGRVTPGEPVTEQQVLDLELEAFLSLCGERKTQERIGYTLKTGKPLRN
jgi:3-hydroxyacyl-CoA dehydrogenase